MKLSGLPLQLFVVFCVMTADSEGSPCAFSGQVYQHGEDFQPNCQHQCTCIDGVVGCIPLCPHQVPLPDWHCSFPRLAQPEGGCCEVWVCDDDNHISEEPDELTHTSLPDSQLLTNHISGLLQVQPQPRHPALTRGDTLGGKHCSISKLAINVDWGRFLMLRWRRWAKLSIKSIERTHTQTKKKHSKLYNWTNPTKKCSGIHLELLSLRYLVSYFKKHLSFRGNSEIFVPQWCWSLL